MMLYIVMCNVYITLANFLGIKDNVQCIKFNVHSNPIWLL